MKRYAIASNQNFKSDVVFDVHSELHVESTSNQVSDDVDALLNYENSDIRYSDDHVVIVDSVANRLTMNKLSLFSNLDTSKSSKIKTALNKSIIEVQELYKSLKSKKFLMGLNW